MRGCQACGLQPEEKPWERGQCKRHALSGQGMPGGGGGGSADGVCRVDCMGLRVGTVQKTDLTWVAVTLLGWGEGGGAGCAPPPQGSGRPQRQTRGSHSHRLGQFKSATRGYICHVSSIGGVQNEGSVSITVMTKHVQSRRKLSKVQRPGGMSTT